MPDPSNSAVVLLSGGLDSSTVLAIARSQGFTLYALSFRYGQRHALELDRESLSELMSEGEDLAAGIADQFLPEPA